MSGLRRCRGSFAQLVQLCMVPGTLGEALEKLFRRIEHHGGKNFYSLEVNKIISRKIIYLTLLSETTTYMEHFIVHNITEVCTIFKLLDRKVSENLYVEFLLVGTLLQLKFSRRYRKDCVVYMVTFIIQRYRLKTFWILIEILESIG